MKVSGFKKYLKIYLIRLRASTMTRMAYPLNFFTLSLGVLSQGLLTILFVNIIYKFTKNISGWSYDQAMLVVASFLLIEGLIWVTNAYLSGIRNNVRLGTLDIWLVKPMDSQFLISTWRVDPEDLMRIVVAGVILAQAITKFNFTFFEWLSRGLVYLLLIFCGYIIFYSIAVMVNCLYFWFTDAGSIHMVFESVIRMSQYPTDIFTSVMAKTIFSTILPIAFLATVPAKAITQGVDGFNILSAIVLALILFVLSRLVWLRGLKVYSSASS